MTSVKAAGENSLPKASPARGMVDKLANAFGAKTASASAFGGARGADDWDEF